MHRSTKFSSVVIAMAVLQLSISCTKHIPVEKDPSTWDKEKVIYVTLLSGDKYLIKNPKVEGEYLIGTTPANIALPGDKEIKIALDEIKQIEIERPDRTKTVIALALAAVPSIGFMILIISGPPGSGLR